MDFTLKDIAMFAILGLLVVNTNVTITVKIFDKRADHGMMEYVDYKGNPVPTFAAVANVPYSIGFIAGACSYIRYSLIEISETANSPIIDNMSYAKIGFMQSFDTMNSIIKTSSFQLTDLATLIRTQK